MRYTLTQHFVKHARAWGTERHPYAELLRALCDDEGHHAIDATDAKMSATVANAPKSTV